MTKPWELTGPALWVGMLWQSCGSARLDQETTLIGASHYHLTTTA
jgi:hypothetical protein